MSSRCHRGTSGRARRCAACWAVVVLAASVVTGGCTDRPDVEARPPDPPTEQPAEPQRAARHELRVCADPNNLPFSNDREEGFENALASLIADEMKVPLRYTWWVQRRGFVRNTLRTFECDVMMGVPTTYELVLATHPYYRSHYVFVYPEAAAFDIRSLDDEVLRTLRIGVHVIGEDYANPPPAHALAGRGIIANVSGYSIFGDYARPNPPARLIDAVAAGEVDVAIAWGPIAGFFAARQAVPLTLTPVMPEIDLPFLPMAFDISMGVRHEEDELRDELNAILGRTRAEIDALLTAFHVPRRARPEPRGGVR